MGQGFPNVNSFLLLDSFDTYHVGTISDVFGVFKDGISMNPQYVAFYLSLSIQVRESIIQIYQIVVTRDSRTEK